MVILENKVLLFSRKLVQQKPGHCQQPFGVLPALGYVEGEVLCGHKLYCLASKLIFAFCLALKVLGKGPGELVLLWVIVWWYIKY